MSAAIAPYAELCRPPLWARSGHAQTILAHLLPLAAPALVEGTDGATALEVPLSDGDRLRALYQPGTSGRLVALFHGLSGDAQADYMRLAARVALAAGHSVLAVDHRGCGAGRGLARGLYHSGRADDLGAVLAWCARELPEERRLVVGFSLSGNALLLLLARGAGELGEAALPHGGVAVNPPVDLERCSYRISRGLNRLYDRRFVRRCTRALEERVADGLLEPGYRIPRVRTLWDFDEEVTAPLGGFADARDYYRRCSTAKLLEGVERPVVVITAVDDPFVSPGDFGPASSSLHLHVEATGGHVGYLEGGATGLGARRWLDGALAHYLRELCAVVA